MPVLKHLRSKAGPAAWLVVAASLLAVAGCSEAVAPEAGNEAPAPMQYEIVPVQALYSLNPGAFSAMQSGADQLSAAVAGSRWCSVEGRWFDPADETCRRTRTDPPFGEVVVEETSIRLRAATELAAPFLWTGPPTGENPFPASGDFMLEFRMDVEQPSASFMGLSIMDADPFETVGTVSPFEDPILRIQARERDGVSIRLLEQTVRLPEAGVPHQYRLVYDDEGYALFVDDEQVAGPIASDRRPTGLWMGNPTFVTYWADWTDIRISQLTVSTPAPAVLPVTVAVKPGECAVSINRRSRGVIPVAIAGTQELDASHIDGSTLKLQGVAPARERFGLEDVVTPAAVEGGCPVAEPDGIPDFTVKFPTRGVADALGDVQDGEELTLELTGNLRTDLQSAATGMPIQGAATVSIR